MRGKTRSSLPGSKPKVTAFNRRVTDLPDVSFILASADLDKVAVQVFTGHTNCWVQAKLSVEQARLYMKHLKKATQQAERNLCTIAKALMRNSKS
ncbi:MAG TPA: hypothetical protein VKZ53_12990 [Candidatus Angelobacter sp.]|nr:hypothetical protein [Candidatus Angelobacter sp.]